MNSLSWLRDRYLDLINQVLPQIARQRRFPIKHNHCFGRVVLDNLCGCCWYEVLSEKGPAYKQLTEEQLARAIAIAAAMIQQPDEHTHQLNQNSLRWRQK